MRVGCPSPRVLAAALATCAWLASAAAAHAAIPSVFNGTATPVPCAVQADGVRLCDETTFVPARPRSTVKSFDGVPIDVRVAFPRQPTTGPDGPYPLVMEFHRYADRKLALASMSAWLARGYAIFTMTDRGFGESCGTQAARAADPHGCAQGYVRLMDTRYEVRDAQELAAGLVGDGLVDRLRIGAVGVSYGAAKAVALAMLKNRKMLPDGSFVPWTTAQGAQIALAGAAPTTGWTDLAASLIPNGTTLDYVADAPYTGRTGVLKQSWENRLYASGLPFNYAPEGAHPSADLRGWHMLLNAGDPYEDPSGDPLPAVAAMREELTAYHSAYYIGGSAPPAPIHITNGWADDLFPADEAIRFYNRTRTRFPGAPISLFLADLGHDRGQSKLPDIGAMAARQAEWMDHYVKGVGQQPFLGVETRTQTCPPDIASGGPYYAPTWADVAPGEVRIEASATRRIAPGAGSPTVAQAFDPVTGDGACAAVPATDQAGTATYRGLPVPASGFTLLGSATLVADITSKGATSQIAARLLDVNPGTDTETLVARGLWRPLVASGPVQQVFQLHPNAYRFAPGHVVKLELLPNDHPSYGQVSNGQAEVRIANARLRLPVLEAPGSLEGLVQSPAPKILPPGYELAADFLNSGYPRPRGATPVRVALVPAFSECMAPGRTHGAPLSFGSCSPPARGSQPLTIGTPEVNGRAAASVGFVDLRPVPDDPNTPGSESDVRLAASLTDVRRDGHLGDYTGELEGRVLVRITDRGSGGAAMEAATVVDTALRAPLGCAATPATDEGSTCATVTSVNALTPGTVTEGSRAVWELGAVRVYDGGVDGIASTPDGEEPFAAQGLFIP